MSGADSTHDPMVLPADLPVPEDDGACDHLPGTMVPPLTLPATDGTDVDLAAPHAGRTIVFAYPRTGRPGFGPAPGWDQIPGARGCTPENCGFRDHHAELRDLGARVFGLSTQSTAEQREMVARLCAPYAVLSDADLGFSRALKLPTFDFAGRALIKRLTLVIREARVEHVFYPVFPPDTHAGEVVRWLSDNPL